MVWEAFSAAGTDELPHCECFQIQNNIAKNIVLPTNEKLFSKAEQSDVFFFNKVMLLPTLQRPPKCGLRTSPSGSSLRVQI